MRYYYLRHYTHCRTIVLDIGVVEKIETLDMVCILTNIDRDV